MDRACGSCLSEAGVEKSLACMFYKHNPEQHSACMHTKFRNISALGQHIRTFHGPEYPLAMSLPSIPKNHQQTPNEKWLWVWYRLFPGHTPPNCPYQHLKEDMGAYVLHQFFGELSRLYMENINVGHLIQSLMQHICSSPKPLSKWQFMDLLRGTVCFSDVEFARLVAQDIASDLEGSDHGSY
ncbi:hypothetical protein F4821DRAFT_247189 [Hypoxylon rubiginosum]|uniref:Uncharacterized protein n=1 Tax=Hypoxylon rubiginosum TaxID=110542 RepID=A0ACC0CPH3_9PEZI|nr:hypothetical protein F4821DRAFT_247189 [Hypoxylon rubiginosum]